MRHSNVFVEVMVRRFLKRSRIGSIAPVEPPVIEFRPRRKPRLASNAHIRAAAVVAILLVSPILAAASVREVGPIGITVNNLERQLMFYTNTLPFELVGIRDSAGPAQDRLFGLNRVRTRQAELKLGDERILLIEHVSRKGRAVPSDSQSHDRWFQHIAIVVRDMDAAYDRLRRFDVKHVSTAPQTIPAWNTNAGGIRAFYFRDPEDHVLEIIWFPPGKGDPKWQIRNSDRVFLGIDHTAIVVSDTETSLKFYRDALGLKVVGESENHGPEQERLNQLFGARLRITGLRAERGPGIEFLEYIAPPGGRDLPSGAQSNDLVFWTTRLVVNGIDPGRLREHGGRFVSKPAGQGIEEMIRDPDGHALWLRIEREISSARAERD